MEPSTILLIVLGVLVALFIGNAGFRQLVRIRTNKAIKSGSTAVEREEDEYNRLMALLPQQEEAVSSVMADASQAENDLKAAEKAVTDAENEYNTGEQLNASEETLDQLAVAWSEAKEHRDSMISVAAEAHKAQAEARAALDETTKALKKFERQLERDKGKERLTRALNISAQAHSQAGNMQQQLGTAQQASREVDHDLAQARARNQLAQGSVADQEMKTLKAKSAASAAREALRAQRDKKTAPAS